MKKHVRFLIFMVISLTLLVVPVFAASVTSITPTWGGVGTTITPVIRGEGFLSGAQVYFERNAMWIQATGETVPNATTITFWITIPSNAPTGLYNVWVQNPGGIWMSKTNAFSVSVLPQVNSISPTSAMVGKTITAYIYGDKFLPGAQIRITDLKTSDIYATDETWINSNAIRCNLTIPINAPTGSYSVYAQNPGNPTNHWFGKLDLFTVTPNVIKLKPDLAVGNFGPPSGAVKRTFPISNSVKNSGLAAAGPFYAYFYLSPDTTFTTADTQIGDRYYSGLGRGITAPIQNTVVTIPNSVPAGSYYLFMIIDLTHVVDESNENNNIIYGINKITIAPPTSSITVTSPTCGDTWQPGTTHLVKWTYTGDPGPNVKVVLMKAGVDVGTATYSTPIGSGGTGSYSWTISSGRAHGTDYQIRVESTSNPSIKGTSCTFTIGASPQSSITVTSPNGGEIWKRGTTQTVKWSYTGNPGPYVKIELLQAGTPVGTATYSTSIGSSGTGSYPWAISSGRAPGTNYRIRVTSVSQPTISDTSNGDFTITL